MISKVAVKGAARRYAPVRLMVSAAAVFALLLLQCATADAAPNRGRPGSDARKAWCKIKFAECVQKASDCDPVFDDCLDDSGIIALCDYFYGSRCVSAPIVRGTDTTKPPVGGVFDPGQPSPPSLLTPKVPSGGTLQQQ
jgi:hypothetical protein